MIPFNQTKIICTIGPASRSKEKIKALIMAGMDVMRLNFSHETHAEHLRHIENLAELNNELSTHVATLLDTKGPEVRTHKFKGGKTTIVKGSEVHIYMQEILGDANNFSVTYSELYNDLEVGDTIIVDDGYLALKVEHIDQDMKIIDTIAQNTHTIKDRRGINIPERCLNLDYISDKDTEDLIFGCKHHVDFVAASFARRQEDIQAVRDILDQNDGKNIQIIAKIENQEGVTNLEAIMDIADGVMIARGDLGVEVAPEEVPVIQKNIIALCHKKGKISITATQMLESMQENARPTRAEVSDVANAILDGSDAIMLSGESAIGKYPVESVETMQMIAKRLEKEIDREKWIARASKIPQHNIPNNIALSVAHATLQGQANLIIAPTVSGNTARLLSKFRPNIMILALVPTAQKARSLALNSCVHPVCFDLPTDTETLVEMSLKYIKENHLAKQGDRVIITGGFPIGTPTNSFRIVDIK